MASGEVPFGVVELTKMAEFHNDLDSSLRLYFSKDSPFYEVQFVEYSRSRIVEELQHRLKEARLMASLAVFAFLEAAFRTDYDHRSRCEPALGRGIGDLCSAFRFRNWLALGRYWKPKFGREYDFNMVFTPADNTLRSFPLYGS
jgi:hypothetical protein